MVRPVQCLGVCKRPTTVAVSGAQGFTFVFGDLTPVAAGDIATFVQSYRAADYGFVPWRQRAGDPAARPGGAAAARRLVARGRELAA